MNRFITDLAVITAMLAFNAVFAAYEMALASVSKSRLLHLKEKGAPGAASAFFMKEQMSASLSVIQLSITLAAAVAAATGGAGVNEYLVPVIQSGLGIEGRAAEFIGLAIFVLPLTLATIIFGELIPKVFALENKELVLLALSPGMKFLYALSHPVVSAAGRVINLFVALANSVLPAKKRYQEGAPISELRFAAAQARADRLISPLEEKIVNSAALLSCRTVEELLIPLSAVSYLPMAMDLPSALVRAHMDLHTRFPVTKTDEAPEDIIGYVNFKDIVNALKMQTPTSDVTGITRPIEKLTSGTSASRALEHMTSKSIHMAVITGAGGSVMGILTLEDIIQQLVGEIKDEYDLLPSHVYAAGSGLIVGGGAMMGDICRRLSITWTGEKVHLAAWLERTEGRFPKGSELIKAGGIEVLVRKTRRHKVSEAFIRKIQPPPPEPDI